MPPTAPDRDEIDRIESAYRRGVHQALACAARWLGQARDLDDARYALSLAVEQAHQYRYRRRHERERLLLDRIDDVARPVPSRRRADGTAPPTADAVREALAIRGRRHPAG
jgi:hypothetical protein